jgi:hypothetical protein
VAGFPLSSPETVIVQSEAMLVKAASDACVAVTDRSATLPDADAVTGTAESTMPKASATPRVRFHKLLFIFTSIFCELYDKAKKSPLYASFSIANRGELFNNFVYFVYYK